MADGLEHLLPENRDRTDLFAAGDVGAVPVQLAQASVDVPVPLGGPGQVAIISVQPGETIVLPVADGEQVLARIGPEGNLAILVDGRTIVLQGYVQSNEDEPVRLITSDGSPVDVAATLAATAPGLDIETAAGPAAGPQATAIEGNGIFTPFAATGTLGGFDALGVLGPTALVYKLISDERRTFEFDTLKDGANSVASSSIPEASPDTALVQQASATNYQLMLVIDVSGSMAETVTRPDGTTTTRMALQKAAIATLLESYAAGTSGSVELKLVKFSDNAEYFGGTSASGFVDVSDPANLAAVIAAINALVPTDRTDYDAALAKAQEGINDPGWLPSDGDTKGLVYFLSDGRPVNDSDSASPYPGGDKGNAVNQAEEDIWEGRNAVAGFGAGLADKGVVSIAVGLGADVARDDQAQRQLQRVAYHSESFPDQSVVLIADENQLAAEIVRTAPATVVGNVLLNDDPKTDGYANPAIIGINAILDSDTTTQTVADTATGYRVETNNGILLIDKITGDYSYTALPGRGGHEDSFTYAIQDAIGGDTDSATLTISITRPTAVTGTAPANGTDANEIFIGDDADNTINGGSGGDSLQGGFGNDALRGDKGDDALYGQEGDDQLFGGDGNDFLSGANGADKLDGGGGEDVLSGGFGGDRLDGGKDDVADKLDGGGGDDVLIWRGDVDHYNGGSDSASIKDRVAGDVLDVSQSDIVDFTTIADDTVSEVETIRMTGGAGTKITLNATDMLADLEATNFNPNGSGSGGNYGSAPALRVDGDSADSVDLADGGWFLAAGAKGVPSGYRLFVHEASGNTPGAQEDSYLLVQNGVTVNPL